MRERMEDLPSVTEDLMTLDYEAIYKIRFSTPVHRSWIRLVDSM